MFIKEMFEKQIDRDIQGVIIVGQSEEENVAQELDEYVVTRELQKHFAEFFSAYKKGIVGNTPKMGVWISGFFGSGKSHFLKILSYLLANKSVGDRKAIDFFADDRLAGGKPKIVDQMVLADMKLAADTSTDVVLFNIDSKSDSNSKQNKDAIVNVFLKVFNEMQGFCGAMPFLADLERRLTEEGRFAEFKEKFEEVYGDAWEDSRQDFDFIQDDVVDVLTAMDFMSEAAARNWCEKASEPYQISIEDFAKRVKAYIEQKGNNHHVVFLVDEIGQYIGEDSKLMLNLQTVTEELGKECMGKAWVIVTSQQDIDSVTKVKGNDFSKIQGRFDTRLSLSSANVDEVIKKRILEKNDTSAQTLRLLYGQKTTIIKNLITFNDGVEKKLYADENDFALVYPFIPYQFNLLASVLTSIRTHGASGKHLSEGERSMLAMFKESAVDYKDCEMGAIIPYNEMVSLQNRNQCIVKNVPLSPEILSKDFAENVHIVRNVGEPVSIDEWIIELQMEHDSLKTIKPRVVDNYDELEEELEEVELILSENHDKEGDLQAEIGVEKRTILELKSNLEIIKQDIMNNKDALRLKKLGSNLQCKSFEGICSTCNQKIQDSLLPIQHQSNVMTIEQTINHLTAQKEMLEFALEYHRNRNAKLDSAVQDIRSKTMTLFRLAKTIRGDLYSVDEDLSETIIYKRMSIEHHIADLNEFKESIKEIVNKFIGLSEKWHELLQEKEMLSQKRFAESDEETIKIFENNFVANLKDFKYTSISNIGAIEISRDNYMPVIDRFDMKFDSSASDNIRAIWSYTLALLQTSEKQSGNHPGLLIFDEPTQHSIGAEDANAFFKSIIALGNKCQVIVSITVNNADIKNVISNLEPEMYKYIHIGEKAFV